MYLTYRADLCMARCMSFILVLLLLLVADLLLYLLDRRLDLLFLLLLI